MTGKRAFLSEAKFTSFGGLASADDLCGQEAADAQIPGTFRALLPVGGSAAASRFPNSAVTTWLRLDGASINAAGTDLFAGGSTLTPLNVTSQGHYFEYDLSGFEAVFTGAATPRTVVEASMTCDDWTNATAVLSTLYGATTRIGEWWAGDRKAACASGLARIYCLEQ
jgi:hypothetical protein